MPREEALLRSTRILAGLAALSLAAPASAAMNADVFYRRALALKAKGPMALFSGDLKKLKAEGAAAGESARAERLAAARTGRKPRYCPPADVRGMPATEFLERLGEIPAADRRRIDMKEATNRILAGKYPCKS